MKGKKRNDGNIKNVRGSRAISNGYGRYRVLRLQADFYAMMELDRSTTVSQYVHGHVERASNDFPRIPIPSFRVAPR